MEKRDEDLILEYQQGNQGALEMLFKRYKKPVFNFALRILSNRADAEDVASEVIMTLFTKSEYYINQPTAKFSTWLFTVARNACLTHIRKQKRTLSLWFNKGNVEEYQEWEVPDTQNLPYDAAIQKETASQVKSAILQLPVSQREALVLREYQKMSYAEIAQVLNCSLENVKILIFRAREELRNKLSSIMTEGNND